MVNKITLYSPFYIFGKACKVIPGQYHLIITEPFFGNQKPLFDGHVPNCGYKVLMLGKVHYHGPYHYSTFGTRREEGIYHRVGSYYWFSQPEWQSIVDVFPLGTSNQEDADKESEFLVKVIQDARDKSLYTPLNGYCV